MAKTVVGLFDTQSAANQAVEALLNQGLSRDDVSVVANDRAGTMPADAVEGTGDSTAAGVATGAIGGGVLGGTLGLLVGIGALAIPGIGPIIAAGPIAAALGAAGTTALVGAGIGAVSGGLLGALVGAGVPEEDAHYYAEGVRRGGTLVMVKADDAQIGSVYNTLQQYGAVDMDNRSSEFREGGWERFDPEGGEWERSSKVGTAAGTAAGAATGAAIGSVGGPVGTVVGGAIGAAAGAATGAAGDAIGQEATEETRAVGTETPVSHRDPVMSDTRRRGARIYDDAGGRYDWDNTNNTMIAASAANVSGVAGSPSAIGGAPGAGLAAAALAPERATGDYHTDREYAGSDTPVEEWKESSKVGTAAGTAAGAATGAAIGSVGGPVGTVVGGAIGAAAGAATGAAGDAAGEATEDAMNDREGRVVDREATNDVDGRKGQVSPRE